MKSNLKPTGGIVPRNSRRARITFGLSILLTAVTVTSVRAQSCPTTIEGHPEVVFINSTNRGCKEVPGGTDCSLVCHYKITNRRAPKDYLNLVAVWYPKKHAQIDFEGSTCGNAASIHFHFSSTRIAYVIADGLDTFDNIDARKISASLLSQIEPLGVPCPGQTSTPKKETGPDPVIFIPGITGSILRSAKDGHFLWPPEYPADPAPLVAVNDDFIRLSLNPKTGPNENLRIDPKTGRREVIYATDAIRSYLTEDFYLSFLDGLKNPKSGGYIEYDVNENPDRRTTTGCNVTQKPKPSLFVFAYDWRLAIEDNADLLADYVGCVAKFYPGKKVNIVTHSMGGLVARRYIIDHPNKVNKLITVAAPFLGSAKPLYQMIYGTLDAELSLKGILKEVIFGTRVQDMLAYYPGLHELLLSETYYSLGGPLYTVVKNQLPDEPPVQVSYGDLMGPGGVVDKLFPDPSYNGKTPAQSNRDFHSYTSRDGNKQDDWSRDTTGVKYYHLFGVQRFDDTPQSLREAAIRSPLNTEHTHYGLLPKGPGDGTVPQLSAERIVNRQSLNASNAKPFIYNTSPKPLLDHAGIMTNPAVLAKVLELLREKDFMEELTSLSELNKSVVQLLAERQATLPIPASERNEESAAGTGTKRSQTTKSDRANDTAANSAGPGYRVRYQGKIYQTTYERHTDKGVPIDVYFYTFTRPDGTQGQNAEKLWGRFVRKPAADSPNATSVEWLHVTWVQRGGVWEQVGTWGVQFEVLGKLP